MLHPSRSLPNPVGFFFFLEGGHLLECGNYHTEKNGKFEIERGEELQGTDYMMLFLSLLHSRVGSGLGPEVKNFD